MIRLDDREGSKQLLQPLQRRVGKANVTLTRLEFGDACFMGYGLQGARTESIGIEVKKLPEFLSSISTGRLAGHQIPGMLEDYDVNWLVIQGDWKTQKVGGPLGFYRKGKKRVPFSGSSFQPFNFSQQAHSYTGAMKFTITQLMYNGVHTWRTSGPAETADAIEAIYFWSRTKPDRHKSHRVIYTPQVRTDGRVALVPPSIRMKVAAQLPGISSTKAEAIAKAFPSVAMMVDATREEWESIPGIGKKLAEGIMRSLGVIEP